MEVYEIKFDIEIEKLSELEDLCKEFKLEELSAIGPLQIYQNSDLLVQETFTKNKTKILISSTNKKIYTSFMEKVNKIYDLSEN